MTTTLDEQLKEKMLNTLWKLGLIPSQVLLALKIELPISTNAQCMNIIRWAKHAGPEYPELRKLEERAPLESVKRAIKRRNQNTPRPQGWGEKFFAQD